MRSLKNVPAILLAAFLFGCSPGSEEGVEQAEAGADAVKNDHVWKEQVETIDRAKDVQKTLDANDEAKRKAMEDAGGG